MKAYKHLVKHALSMGCTVSVWDGEEWQVKRSTGYKAIIDAIESVEEAQLRIRRHGDVIGWALVSAFGLEDDETVVDHTCTSFMDEWSEIYEATI
jgi:hypothetical protein